MMTLPSGASRRSLTCAATGKTAMTSADSADSETSSRTRVTSAGFEHACEMDLSDSDKRRDEDRNVVI